MAIKAGISYFLKSLGYDEVELTLISDGKDRKSRPEQGLVDNFEEYIPYRVEKDNLLAQESSSKPYPVVRMLGVQVIDSVKTDLLQLTDLLLGATQAALVGVSKRPVKQELGKMVARWYQDLRKPPGEQKYKMHRKFSLWGFPDEQGEPFNRFDMALSQCDEQPSLF